MAPAFVIRITIRVAPVSLFIIYLFFSIFLFSSIAKCSILIFIFSVLALELVTSPRSPGSFFGEAFLDVKKNTMVFPYITHNTLKALYSGSPNVWSFLPPPQPPHQAILQHQLGVVQYNAMLTLSTQR